MTGDDRSRFCEQCALHVYDFSHFAKRRSGNDRRAEGRCARTLARSTERFSRPIVGRHRAAEARIGAAVSVAASFATLALGDSGVAGARAEGSTPRWLRLDRAGEEGLQLATAPTANAGLLRSQCDAGVAHALVKLILQEEEETVSSLLDSIAVAHPATRSGKR